MENQGRGTGDRAGKPAQITNETARHTNPSQTHKLRLARDQKINDRFHNRRGTAGKHKQDVKSYPKSSKNPRRPHQDRDINEPACPSNTAKKAQPGNSGISATAVCASSMLDLQPCICDTAYDTEPPVPDSESFFVMGVYPHHNGLEQTAELTDTHHANPRPNRQTVYTPCKQQKPTGNSGIPHSGMPNEPQGRRPYKGVSSVAFGLIEELPAPTNAVDNLVQQTKRKSWFPTST